MDAFGRLLGKGIPRRNPSGKPIPGGGEGLHYSQSLKPDKSPTKVYQEFKGDHFCLLNKGKCTSSVFCLDPRETGNPMGVWGDLLASGNESKMWR